MRRNVGKDMFWSEVSAGECNLFVVVGLEFSYRTVTTPNCTPFVVYPVNVVLLNSFEVYWEWLLEKGLTFEDTGQQIWIRVAIECIE